jgi:7-carboxy-7-deazaguanine synthase
MTLSAVLEKVRSFKAKFVCLTGGEPLIQKGSFLLMKLLCDEGYFVSCETSGAQSCLQIDPRVKIILDVKTPSSGEVNSFALENLQLPPERVEIKFVIANEEDFLWSEDFCKKHGLSSKFQILYSPSFSELAPERLAEMILTKGSPARLQLQLHKYIWQPDKRGV